MIEGKIDSLNLSISSKDMLCRNNSTVLEDVKSIGVFEPKRWLESFGRTPNRNEVELSIIHTPEGLEIPLKRFNRNTYYTLELAGFESFNDRSKFLKDFLINNFDLFIDSDLKRIDVAIDYEGNSIPNSVMKKLQRNRKPFKFKNTIYFKSDSESKTNNTIDIKLYNKQLKENLSYPLMRLEFCFKGVYLKGMTLSNINYEKIEKSIKNFSGVEVEITRFWK